MRGWDRIRQYCKDISCHNQPTCALIAVPREHAVGCKLRDCPPPLAKHTVS